MIHNCNYFTKHAALDLCVDETTWGFGGHGGPHVYQLMNKKKSRGGQLVLLLDCGTMRPRGVIHRHKKQEKCPGWNMDLGPSEVRQLVEQFVEENVGPGKLWSKKPHITAANHFSHDVLFNWLGEKGYGYIGTVARDRLISGIENKYFHKERSKDVHVSFFFFNLNIFI